jgi:acyl carrier protein
VSAGSDLKTRLAGLVTRSMGAPEEALLQDKSFADLGLDSLDVVDLRIALEEELGVNLEGEASGRDLPKNLSELADLVQANVPAERLASFMEARPAG